MTEEGFCSYNCRSRVLRAEKEGAGVSDVLRGLLIEELRYRQERSLLNRQQQARLPWDFTLTSFPFELQPAVSKAQVMELAGLAFLERHENIVFIGPPGTGKTGLATGLLRKALSAIDLLVIDELGYLTLTTEHANTFFKLMGDSYGKKSTIITTNLKYEH